jgi:hypothetical protein
LLLIPATTAFAQWFSNWNPPTSHPKSKVERSVLMTDLTNIPGIGKNMEPHLIRAGYPDIDSLKGQDREVIYAKD